MSHLFFFKQINNLRDYFDLFYARIPFRTFQMKNQVCAQVFNLKKQFRPNDEKQ